MMGRGRRRIRWKIFSLCPKIKTQARPPHASRLCRAARAGQAPPLPAQARVDPASRKTGNPAARRIAAQDPIVAQTEIKTAARTAINHVGPCLVNRSTRMKSNPRKALRRTWICRIVPRNALKIVRKGGRKTAGKTVAKIGDRDQTVAATATRIVTNHAARCPATRWAKGKSNPRKAMGQGWVTTPRNVLRDKAGRKAAGKNGAKTVAQTVAQTEARIAVRSRVKIVARNAASLQANPSPTSLSVHCAISPPPLPARAAMRMELCPVMSMMQ